MSRGEFTNQEWATLQAEGLTAPPDQETVRAGMMARLADILMHGAVDGPAAAIEIPQVTRPYLGVER